MANTFSEFFNAKRRATGLPLRKFCQENGFDPGNLSKIERGLVPAPQMRKVLEQYANALGIQRESEEWYEFFDLAAISAGKIPSDIASDIEVVNALPVLFRSIRNTTTEKHQLENLIEIIRKELR